MGKLLRLLVVFATAIAVASPAIAQERGVIRGTVTTQAGGLPVVGATVTISGTALRAVTAQDGEYRITNVPAGTHDVTASILGYAPRSQRVAVAAGQTATASFALEASALEIGGLVVTATGREQRQREIGSAVSTINTANVEMAAVPNMASLIQGRSAGVVVLPSSGTTGAGARVRIRGNNSISRSNAPLIIVDGIRVESGENPAGFGVGGQEPSRLNDLNPEDIESIEILKGPSAAALYGTAAANGVIQVTTKRGRAGAPRFRAWTEFGRLERTAEFPENVSAVTSRGGVCPLIFQNSGICTAVETFRFNPLENPETTPFERGDRRVVGGSVSGGSEDATFYVSAELEDEDGVYQQRDGLRRVNTQANLTGRLGSTLNVGVNVGLSDQDLELPLGDNAGFGIIGMGVLAPATPRTVERNQGYEADPQFFRDWITTQDQNRLTGSARADYRPLPWLSLNGTAGVDRTARDEINRLPRNTVYNVFGSVYRFGFIQNYDFEITNYTTNGSATAIFNLSDDLVSTTSAGSQFLREEFNRVYTFGAGLVPGAETSLGGATSDFSASEANVRNATLGAYAQQQIAWRDRVFVNGAVRGDKNSAFGVDLGWVWYPALSGSWVVSDESFFPENRFLDNFRLRAAWGRSGLRPSTNDALFFFTPQVVTVAGADIPAFSLSEVGNPSLRPEKSTELEMGFESGFLDGRVGLEMSYFAKQSEDALVNLPLPPSLGGPNNQFRNLAEVRNSGWEVLLSGQPIRNRRFETNFTLTGSIIENELVELGTDPTGRPLDPVIFGQQRHVEGFPLGGYWQRPFTFADENNDGVISFGEVDVAKDFEFMGSPFPKREFALNADVGLFGLVKVSTLFDYKGGHRLLNMSRAWRESYYFNAPAAFEGTQEDQAAQIALLLNGSYAGFIEDADFVKWRELALTVGVPDRLVRRFGARGLNLTVAGRNLKTWTDYTGLDPELNRFGQANFSTAEFLTLPPNRYVSIRLDANF